jgi:L-rhamnose mutarotase
MERVAFTMRLKPGFEREYRKRHDEIWPELTALISGSGISDYSIFLDRETLTLFGIQKRSPGSTADGLSAEPLMRRWWDYMKDLMETNADGSPVAKSLTEVFHMD